MQRAPYQTKQKAAILECLYQNNEAHFTIPQIAEQLKAAGTAVSTPTIYRYLDTLVAEGKVRKYVLDGNAGSCYQYNSESENEELFHFRCEKCGRLLHFQSEELQQLNARMKQCKSGKIYLEQTVFYGICENCEE
ncbi:Fur family transcriptional regulator [Anaerotignum sp.]|uniref:Fur family transcriptional regulator n=1 Tax=Anaerotignum sp. TaxID=2039241 RepID=UPI0028A807F0|nr:transcriptional repressor [Anaerotignum sp.]